MPSNLQPHIRCKKNDISQYVLLPGDPGRISGITKYWQKAKKIAYNREFLTYTGRYKDVRISATSTGIGCPSAAIAVEELANIGAKFFIRIGTCGGLLKEMEPGDIIIPESAACLDGTTREYDPSIKKAPADEKIFELLKKNAEKMGVKYFTGVNRTHDAFYEPTANFVKLAGQGFVSSEMECSSVFLVSKLRNLQAGAILVVNTPEPPEEVAKNPDMVYRLIDMAKVRKGTDAAIKIALETVKSLSESAH